MDAVPEFTSNMYRLLAACFGRRLDHLARFESQGATPRQWKGGSELKLCPDAKSIDNFEASFFAQARLYLDGYAVDGPLGYPVEATRRF